MKYSATLKHLTPSAYNPFTLWLLFWWFLVVTGSNPAPSKRNEVANVKLLQLYQPFTLDLNQIFVEMRMNRMCRVYWPFSNSRRGMVKCKNLSSESVWDFSIFWKDDSAFLRCPTSHFHIHCRNSKVTVMCRKYGTLLKLFRLTWSTFICLVKRTVIGCLKFICKLWRVHGG